MLLLQLATACSFGLSEIEDDDGGDETTIESLDPTRGPPRGGTAVTITGDGFDGDDIKVTFGGLQGTEIQVIDDETLVVLTPRVSLGGATSVPVEVKVVNENGSDTLTGGYTYTTEEVDTDDTGGLTDDSGDTDTDTDTGTDTDTDTTPSIVGMVRGYVSYDWTIIYCAQCFGLDDPSSNYVAASAMFHEPADGSWLEWLPTEDSCTISSPTELSTAGVDAGTSVTLTNGTITVSLTGSTGSRGMTYASSTLPPDQYTESDTFDVANAGGADLPAFTFPDALETTGDFSAVTPDALLSRTTSSAYTASFSSSGTNLTWSPSSVGDFVLVSLESGSSVVTCRFADDGTATVPGSAVSSFSSGTQLTVRMVRYDTTESTFDDGTIVELMSRHEAVGTGVVR